MYVPAAITFDGFPVSGGVRYRGSSTFYQAYNPWSCSVTNLCGCPCDTPFPITGAGCKYPLALKLDERIGGVERLDLNNLDVDQSALRDVLARSMLNEVTPGQRFSFTRVYIGPSTEGGFIDLGLYLNLEHVDSEFVERRFLGEDPYRYSSGGYTPQSCINQLDQYDPEGGNPDGTCEERMASIRDFIAHMDEHVTNGDPNVAGFEAELDQYVDVDNLAWHYAFWVLMGTNDGAQHETIQDNFHSHLNGSGYDSGRLKFLASDVDRVFILPEQELDYPFPDIIPDTILGNDGIRLRMEHHVRHLMNTRFNEETFLCWGNGTGAMIVPELSGLSESNWASYIWPDFEETNWDNFDTRLSAILDYVNDRRTHLEGFSQFTREEAKILKAMHSPDPATEEAVEVKARIISKSLLEANLYWRTTGAFQKVAMSPGKLTEWCATIPAQDAHTRVEYYIEAIHVTGTGDAASYLPVTAAQHPFSYLVAESWSDSKVVINEVLAKGDDWIELHNPTNEDVFLNDFTLNQGEGPDVGFVFTEDLDPEDRTIPAGGYLVIHCDVDGMEPLNTDFGLSKNGDTVALYDGAGALVDHIRFARSFDLMSRGREFDGDYDWVEKYVPTPGASNGVFADFNGDLIVDTVDLNILLAAFGTTCCMGCPEDLNGDEIINTQDLLLLLAAYTG